MPKGVKSVARDWPLDNRERQIVAKAWAAAQPGLRGYCRRYPRHADEIQSEFGRSLVSTVHRYERGPRRFRVWVGQSLRYAVLRVLRLGAGRSKEFRDGSCRFISIEQPIRDARSRFFGSNPVDILAVSHEFGGVADYLCGLGPRASQAIVLASEGVTVHEISRQLHVRRKVASELLAGARAKIRESIERASA